jgi:hypothetical protein
MAGPSNRKIVLVTTGLIEIEKEELQLRNPRPALDLLVYT